MATSNKKKTPAKKAGEKSTNILPILESIRDLAVIGLTFASLFKNRGKVAIPAATEDFTFTPTPPTVG